MTETFQPLLLAMATFVIGHIVIASLPVREAVIGRIGVNGFRILFSVFALVTLVWAIRSYAAAPYEELWAQTTALRQVPAMIMPIACILAVAGVSTRNVTSVGGETLSPMDAPSRGIVTVTRHPLMWGFALWALAHLAPNGDVASVIFFGGMALLSLLGMRHIDHRRQATMGSDWGPMALTTSAIPFVAYIQGRTKIDWKGIGLTRLALGLGHYVAILMAHEWAFGVSPMPAG
ncbi:MAG: NnrU family protein [Rickettsiales bacterium]